MSTYSDSTNIELSWSQSNKWKEALRVVGSSTTVCHVIWSFVSDQPVVDIPLHVIPGIESTDFQFLRLTHHPFLDVLSHPDWLSLTHDPYLGILSYTKTDATEWIAPWLADRQTQVTKEHQQYKQRLAAAAVLSKPSTPLSDIKLQPRDNHPGFRECVVMDVGAKWRWEDSSAGNSCLLNARHYNVSMLLIVPDMLAHPACIPVSSRNAIDQLVLTRPIVKSWIHQWNHPRHPQDRMQIRQWMDNWLPAGLKHQETIDYWEMQLTLDLNPHLHLIVDRQTKNLDSSAYWSVWHPPRARAQTVAAHACHSK